MRKERPELVKLRLEPHGAERIRDAHNLAAVAVGARDVRLRREKVMPCTQILFVLMLPSDRAVV